MASILVYIESVGDSLRDISLDTLEEGRRLASALGAPLHALVLTATPDVHQARWEKQLGSLGADRVSIAEAVDVRGPVRWNNIGMTVHAACIRLQPALVLMAASDTGADIAPRLAARMQSDFLSRPDTLYKDDDLAFSFSMHSDEGAWQVPASALRFGSVLTLSPGDKKRPERGIRPAGSVGVVLPLERLASPRRRMDFLQTVANDDLERAHARVVVSLGGGVNSSETYELAEVFAQMLGAQLAATETLCARGIAPTSLAIGDGVRHIDADLYLACGSSGSPQHLGALSPNTTIVAINNDPDAPIFDVASYGLIGDVETVLPALIDALAEARAQRGNT